MNGTTEESFKERLDGYYDWPCAYVFKFIAPAERLEEVTGLFAEDVGGAHPPLEAGQLRQRHGRDRHGTAATR